MTNVWVGKIFTAKIISNPIDANLGSGPQTGDVRGIANVVVNMKNTWSMSVNGRKLITDTGFSGNKEFKILGYSREPRVTIEQTDPLPIQINGIVAELMI